jgi:hypothetical protein
VRVKIAIGVGFAIGLVFARTGMNAQNPLTMMFLCPAYWIFGMLQFEDPGIVGVVLGIFLLNALVFARYRRLDRLDGAEAPARLSATSFGLLLHPFGPTLHPFIR